MQNVKINNKHKLNVEFSSEQIKEIIDWILQIGDQGIKILYNQIESLTAKFFCSGNVEERKIHWFSWEKIG